MADKNISLAELVTRLNMVGIRLFVHPETDVVWWTDTKWFMPIGPLKGELLLSLALHGPRLAHLLKAEGFVRDSHIPLVVINGIII